MSENPSIIISLNPILEAYCRWVFEADNKGPIKLDRSKEIALNIFANISPSYQPLHERPVKKDAVEFILPLTDVSKGYLRSNFLKVNGWQQQKIQDFIDSSFRAWVRGCFEVGYYKRCEQKQIIEAILRGLNLRNNTDNFDMIKKIDYRNRRKKEAIRFEALLSCSY